MRNLKLTKIIASLLITASVLALNPIGASAQWKQDSNGWWNSEGNSWSVGWKKLYGEWYYFDNNGYMKTGWIQYKDKWYYLYSSGAMAKNATINGYKLDSDGVWIQTVENNLSDNENANSSTKNNDTQEIQNSSSKVNSEVTTISDVTNIKFDDITKIVFYDGRGGLNKPVTVKDKQKVKEFMGYLDNYRIKEIKDPELSTGWIHSANFYINDTEVMRITFVDPMIINGNYYNIIQGNLDFEKISKFLKSIDPSYNIMVGLI